MKASVFSHTELIGTTFLQVGDASMGCLFGEFIPTGFYLKNIQRSVWDFWRTSIPNYKRWTALRLNVQLENGVFLYPEGGYTIDDLKDLPDEPKRIDIAGINSEIIEAFLINPVAFVAEPWEEIDIEQKIEFEDELRRELGLDKKSILGFLSKPISHILSDSEFSALCTDQRSDDVLFEIRKPNCEERFALVHLTWTGKRERANYPKTTLYRSFEEFRTSRMLSDRVDWES